MYIMYKTYAMNYANLNLYMVCRAILDSEKIIGRIAKVKKVAALPEIIIGADGNFQKYIQELGIENNNYYS